MRVVHIHFPEDTSDFDKQLYVNRMATLLASLGELCEVAGEHYNNLVPTEVIGGLIMEVMNGSQTEEALQATTKAGLEGSMEHFNKIDGKENLPDNVVSFGDAKNKRTMH